MPSGSESAQAMDRIRTAFPAGVLSPTSVFLTGPGLTEEKAKGYAQKLAAVPIVGGVGGVTVAGDVAQVDLQLTADPTSEQAMNAVRDDLRPAAEAAAPPGTEVAVGGMTAALVDVRTVIDRDLPIIFAVAAGLIGLLLLLMLRGLVAPLYLLGAVALGFIATLGASTVAFQQLAGKPGVGWQTPLIVYLFVTAIGTDYNILMIARIREELRAGRTPREAAAEALRHAGPSVAAAGFILAGSFAVLMLSAASQEIGFAVAVGVLFSTFILSWLLVPALTALFGRAAFWPSRVVPRDRGRHAVERTDELVLSAR
jgi:RND superfamily putative drug exporter